MTRLTTRSRSIEGRVAIVTGAASGMGRATAHLFADEGARLVIVDLNAEGVEQVAKEIRGAGGDVLPLAIDVTDHNAVADAVSQIVERFAAIDILVNNAGISIPAPLHLEDYDERWERTLAVNLTAHIVWVRRCLPHLEESDAARIVNIASTEGLGASAFASPYTASKHGVIGLTRSLAMELGPKGITVNCICPGPIHTGMTAVIPDEAKTKFARRRVPLRRYGEPEEVAHGTLNFVLPASSYINGTVLPVDGGLTIQNT